jgi:hypothetical protein
MFKRLRSAFALFKLLAAAGILAAVLIIYRMKLSALAQRQHDYTNSLSNSLKCVHQPQSVRPDPTRERTTSMGSASTARVTAPLKIMRLRFEPH